MISAIFDGVDNSLLGLSTGPYSFPKFLLIYSIKILKYHLALFK